MGLRLFWRVGSRGLFEAPSTLSLCTMSATSDGMGVFSLKVLAQDLRSARRVSFSFLARAAFFFRDARARN